MEMMNSGGTHCRCCTGEIPGGFRIEETPQFIWLTFDDHLNTQHHWKSLMHTLISLPASTHPKLFLSNSGNCASYALAAALLCHGGEVAGHSFTHATSPHTPNQMWAHEISSNNSSHFCLSHCHSTSTQQQQHESGSMG